MALCCQHDDASDQVWHTVETQLHLAAFGYHLLDALLDLLCVCATFQFKYLPARL